jgi:hypothetical protein
LAAPINSQADDAGRLDLDAEVIIARALLVAHIDPQLALRIDPDARELRAAFEQRDPLHRSGRDRNYSATV